MLYLARLFDGKTAGEKQAEVRLIPNGQVEVKTVGPESVTYKVQAKKLDVGNYDGNGLQVRFPLAGNSALLLFSDQGFKAELYQYGFAGKPREGDAKYWILAIASVLVIGGLLFGMYKALRPVSYWLAHLVPLETEAEIFSAVAKGLLDKKCEDTAADRALQTLKNRITSGLDKDIDVDVHLVKMDLVNAFALPGGKVFLTTGLVKESEDANEIAGVLAHEIQHVKHRHVLGEFIRSTLLVSAWAILFQDVSGFLVVDPGTLSQLLELNFSRTAEQEADRGAIDSLVAAGIALDGFEKFFKRLNTDSSGDGDSEFNIKLPSFLSTHPDSEERAFLVREARMALEAKGQVLKSRGLSNADFQHLKLACSDNDSAQKTEK